MVKAIHCIKIEYIYLLLFLFVPYYIKVLYIKLLLLIFISKKKYFLYYLDISKFILWGYSSNYMMDCIWGYSSNYMMDCIWVYI